VEAAIRRVFQHAEVFSEVSIAPVVFGLAWFLLMGSLGFGWLL
jgi:hypothetical protein